MRRLALLALLIFPMFLSALVAPLAQRTHASTALLYTQSEDGGMHMACTATAFEKTAKGYLFVTAAHCAASDDTQHERVEVRKTRFFITYDELGDKKFMPARLVVAGYQHRGDDFSIFEILTDQTWVTTPLGDEAQVTVGDEIINVASPQGLGRQVFHGWITLVKVDRPIYQSDINWSSAMLLQVEAGPGSSGSAIVSVRQEAIVAFLVGHYDQNTFAVPVSQFKKFRKMFEDGKYTWFVPVQE